MTGCHASFDVAVADLRGGVRPAYYTGEALDLQVRWDAGRDKNKEVDCQIVDTYAGSAVWQGTATVPDVRAGSLEPLTFDPALPRNGQLGLKTGGYQWVCDLDGFTRAGTYFDIIQGR